MFGPEVLSVVRALPVPAIIYIAGPTCAGKTTLAKWLSDRLNSNVIIPMDNYYFDYDDPSLPRSNQYPTFDTPEAYHLKELEGHLWQLKNGEDVDIPTYDIATNSRLPNKERISSAHDYYLIEGLYAFSLRPPGYKIFVTASQETRRNRRLTRDRANLPTSISIGRIESHFWHVERTTDDLILPQQSQADLIIQSELQKGDEVR